MRRTTFKNAILLILIVSLLSIGLTSCVDIVVPVNTGAARIYLSGTYRYNILIDGELKLSNKEPGTYTISDIPAGYHDFEAIDTYGASWGYDIEEDVYISAGTTTNVYLDPTETTATVYIVVSGTGPGRYDIKIDGITKLFNKPSGTYEISNVSVGDHTFEAVDTWGASFGYDIITQFIYPGDNYVYLYPLL